MILGRKEEKRQHIIIVFWSTKSGISACHGNFNLARS